MRALLLVAVAACSAPPPKRHTPPAVDPLIGLWGAELDFGPALAGPLEVRQTTAGWEATIAGRRAPLREHAGELRGAFDDAGELRVHGDPRARLTGHWIQPGGTVANQPFATPLTLTRGADGVLRGTVTPLRDLANEYIVIEPRAGGLVAWIRETERNVGRFVGDLTVERRADGTIAFRTESGDAVLTGRLTAPDTLAITLDDLPQLIHTRRGRADAPGFHPAAPGPWTYHPPTAGPDAWPVATLADAGFDPAAVAAIIERLRAATPTSWRSPAVHAIVIARHGKLVLDEYFAGHHAERTHDLRSAGKTISTTLVGIAADRGLLSLDDRIFDAIPSTAPADPRRADLRLAHLASMSSGLDCDDRDPASPGGEDRMQQQRAEPDWYRFMAALPLVRAPGAQGVYCTGALNLLGAALVRATARWLPDLFAEWYAAPLDIHHYALNLTPTGEGYLGGGLRLRPRDFAKLPQLVLSAGTWRGRRVVSAAWLTLATAPHASLDAPDDYGYGWWRRTLTLPDGRTVDVVYASGNGGQLGVAVPALDLVISLNGGNYGNYPAWRTFLDELVPQLIAAITVR